MDKAYDVYHKNSDKLIGYKWGTAGGGLVYDADGEIIGTIRRGVGSEWVLIADQPHHTGRPLTGDTVVWDSRPSKNFTV